jgi:ABC-2 type transport system permease protein
MKKSLFLFLRTLNARAYVRIFGQMREATWVLASIVGGFFTMTTYVYLYRTLGKGSEFSGLVVLGGFMTPFFLNVLWGVATQLYWEKEMGNLELMLVSPAPLSAFLVGLSVGGAMHTLLRSIAVLFFGIAVFRVKFLVLHLPQAFLVFLLTLFAMYGLGIVFSSLFLYHGRDAWRTADLVMEPTSVLSGIYFPAKFLGLGLAGVAALIPTTLGLDALRQLLVPSFMVGLLDWRWEALVLLGLGLSFAFIASRALRSVEYKARRDARLTLRWQ